MTSLHRKWSPKVAMARTKVDDGGVAACLNWSYGTRSTKTADKQLEKAEQQEEAARQQQTEQRDQTTRRQQTEERECRELGDVAQFQDAVGRVFVDIHVNKENDPYKANSPDSLQLDDPDERPTNSPRGSVSRMGQHPGTPIQNRPSTAPEQRVRSQTPARCQHIAPSERVNVKVTKLGPQQSDPPTNKQQPLNSTKKFLKTYFNKPLTDDELRYILKETHKRISDDLVEETLRERSKVKAKAQTRSYGNQRQPVRVLAVPPRQQYQLELNDASRPLIGQALSRDGVPAGNATRPLSAASLTRNVTGKPTTPSGNKHFSAWRPNGLAPRQGWTQSSNNYDDLWRLAAKYRTKRRQAPNVLGACRYGNKHVDIESQYLRHRPSSAPGSVSLQLNCCPNSDMVINIRLQKSALGPA